MLIIGSKNVFEVDCTVESPKIGDNNIFESKCFVGNKVVVTNGCIVGAGCRLTTPQTLKENVIIYGENCQQRIGLDRPPVCRYSTFYYVVGLKSDFSDAKYATGDFVEGVA